MKITASLIGILIHVGRRWVAAVSAIRWDHFKIHKHSTLIDRNKQQGGQRTERYGQNGYLPKTKGEAVVPSPRQGLALLLA